MSPSLATSTPRPCYPDYSKLPNFHYLPSTKTPTSGRKPDDYQSRAQIKQKFQEDKFKAGDEKAIKQFSGKYAVSEKLVTNYIEHLTGIEMRKDKQRTEACECLGHTYDPFFSVCNIFLRVTHFAKSEASF